MKLTEQQMKKVKAISRNIIEGAVDDIENAVFDYILESEDADGVISTIQQGVDDDEFMDELLETISEETGKILAPMFKRLEEEDAK